MKNSKDCIGCGNNFVINKYKSFKKFCSIECYRKNAILIKNNGRFKKGHIPFYAGKKMPKWLKDKLSEARFNSPYHTGKLHPRWKGGKRGYYNDIARKILLQSNIPFRCFICKRILKILHIHHIDRNWKNNNINNLMFICISCHLKIHHKEDKTKNICQWCEKIFYSGRIAKKFCSNTCRSRDWVSQNLEKNKQYKHNWYLARYKRLEQQKENA